MTHEEMVVEIRAAAAKVPPLGQHDWKTIHQSLSRERRRVAALLGEIEEDLHEGPEVNQFLALLRSKIQHITKIMTIIGDGGRQMLISPGVGGLDCRNKQGEGGSPCRVDQAKK